VGRQNLPEQLTSLVGRVREVADVQTLLEGARLVTLTGAGGVGKTRLALAVAAELVVQYADGVWLAELAALADPALVSQAVAGVLGLREEPNHPILATLIDHLKGKHLLLVLDNCEHLVGACADLASALLRACPGLRILATSREGLGVTGEQQYRVPSLSVPDLKHVPPPQLVGGYEAVRLFVARAQARRCDFVLAEANAQVVAAICARLDGIPLAIELAAVRVSSLPVEAIAERLDQRFRLLTGGPRDALPRQQTLRAALDWSHDLLTAPEQVLLRRLSVFAGGWTLAAAEAVCAGDGIEAWEILDLLDGLVNKSLVLLEDGAEEARYRLLETVRQYGWERLAASSEEAAVGDRHLAWCVTLAEEAASQLRGSEQGAWLARLEREHDNLRAALAWTRQQGVGELGLRLAGALWHFWRMRGYFSEGRDWLEAALADHDQGLSPQRATALHGAATLANVQSDYGRAAALHGEALALRRALGDVQGIAASLNGLGSVASSQSQYGQASVLFKEAETLWRALGDNRGVAISLVNLGKMASFQGEYERAVNLTEEALALARTLGDTSAIAASLINLAMVAYLRGDHGRAITLLEERLALQRALGNTLGIASSLTNLGRVTYARTAYGQAAALLKQGLQLSHVVGAKDMVAAGLEILAWTNSTSGQPQRAAQLGGAAEALQQALGLSLPPDWPGDRDRALRATRAALGEEAFAAAWAEGRALPLEAAIALALEQPGG
jgi:non-specific serine/threonine protein kinase